MVGDPSCGLLEYDNSGRAFLAKIIVKGGSANGYFASKGASNPAANADEAVDIPQTLREGEFSLDIPLCFP